MGEVMKRGVEWAMRTPEQGAMSVLWSAVSDEARLPKYPQGTCASFSSLASTDSDSCLPCGLLRVDFSDPNELGQESSEAKDEELVRAVPSFCVLRSFADLVSSFRVSAGRELLEHFPSHHRGGRRSGCSHLLGQGHQGDQGLKSISNCLYPAS